MWARAGKPFITEDTGRRKSVHHEGHEGSRRKTRRELITDGISLDDIIIMNYRGTIQFAHEKAYFG